MNNDAVHLALVHIFGAEPEQVIVTNPDHFSITADLRQLCIAVGGKWEKLVRDLEERMAEMKVKKNAGEDPRMRVEPKTDVA